MEDENHTKKELFQEFIANTPLGTEVIGTVNSIQRFGIFVDIHNIPFHGLIEIVLSRHFDGTPLPFDWTEWPQKGESICCRINYFREENFEIGLGWLPE